METGYESPLTSASSDAVQIYSTTRAQIFRRFRGNKTNVAVLRPRGRKRNAEKNENVLSSTADITVNPVATENTPATSFKSNSQIIKTIIIIIYFSPGTAL